MAALLHRSRTSTGMAVLIGAAVGLVAVGVYLSAGVLVADWSSSEFVAHFSVGRAGYFLGMIAMAIAVFGIPIAALLRFNLTTPLVIFALVVLGWLTIGTVQGLLSLQTIFGVALYAAFLSPLYLVLYGVLGGGEYLFRRRAISR